MGVKGSGPCPGDLLNPQEAADYLRVNRRTLLTAIRAGAVPVLRVSPRTFRVSRRALEELAAKGSA